jgi:hypothetical protein
MRGVFGWIPARFPALGPSLYERNAIPDFLKFFRSWALPFSSLARAPAANLTAAPTHFEQRYPREEAACQIGCTNKQEM